MSNHPGNVHPIYQALSQFEQHFWPDNPLPTRQFTLSPPWGVRSGFLRGGRDIPGLQAKHLLSLFFSLQKKRVCLAANPHIFQIKADMSRLRAFYLPEENRPAICVKILDANGVWSERAMNEIRQRDIVERLGAVSLPRIASHGLIGDYMYIVEDLIQGRRFSFRRDVDLFIRQALPELVRMYQGAGIEQRAITDYFPVDLPQDVRRMDESGGDCR